MATVEKKRIINLAEKSAPENGDFFAVDSQAGGTKKIPATALAKAADLTAEAAARTQADNALTGAINSASALIQNPTKTLSGALCSFTDGANMPMVACTAEITPKQSGSGTPSPENVRPISGWSSVDVWGDPKYGGTVAWNQLVSTMRSTSSEKGLTFTRNSDGSLDISGTITEAFSYNYVMFTSAGIRFKRDGRKYLLMLNKPIPYAWGISGYGGTISANSIGGMWSNNAGTDWENGLVFRAEVGTTIDIQNLRAMVFDLTQMFGSTVADYVYGLERATAGAGVAWFKKLFPKDYYEYNTGEETCVSAVNGDVYIHNTVNLGRTVYGGTLDVVSGVLTVTHGIVDLGTLDWTYDSSSNRFYTTGISELVKRLSDNYGVADSICSAYSVTSLNEFWSSTDGKYAISITGAVSIRDSRYTDAAAFKTAMNGVKLVYELATPQTYTLTPTEVSTLLGENNVWADSGDVEITYRRDISIVLENLENALSGSNSLNAMMMSAPTENTAEEPTEDEAEDDMR